MQAPALQPCLGTAHGQRPPRPSSSDKPRSACSHLSSVPSCCTRSTSSSASLKSSSDRSCRRRAEARPAPPSGAKPAPAPASSASLPQLAGAPSESAAASESASALSLPAVTVGIKRAVMQVSTSLHGHSSSNAAHALSRLPAPARRCLPPAAAHPGHCRSRRCRCRWPLPRFPTPLRGLWGGGGAACVRAAARRAVPRQWRPALSSRAPELLLSSSLLESEPPPSAPWVKSQSRRFHMAACRGCVQALEQDGAAGWRERLGNCVPGAPVELPAWGAASGAPSRQKNGLRHPCQFTRAAGFAWITRHAAAERSTPTIDCVLAESPRALPALHVRAGRAPASAGSPIRGCTRLLTGSCGRPIRPSRSLSSPGLARLLATPRRAAQPKSAAPCLPLTPPLQAPARHGRPAAASGRRAGDGAAGCAARHACTGGACRVQGAVAAHEGACWPWGVHGGHLSACLLQAGRVWYLAPCSLLLAHCRLSTHSATRLLAGGQPVCEPVLHGAARLPQAPAPLLQRRLHAHLRRRAPRRLLLQNRHRAEGGPS